MDQNTPVNNNSVSASDSMPPIPVFDPAPAPNPVVTDSMPPIPVSSLPQEPVAPPTVSDMPAMATPVVTPKPVVPAISNIPTVTTSNPDVAATPTVSAPAAPAAPTMPTTPTAMRPTANPQVLQIRQPAMQQAPVAPRPQPAPVAPAPQPAPQPAPRPVQPNMPSFGMANSQPTAPVQPNQAPVAPAENPILKALETNGAPAAAPQTTDPFAPRSSYADTNPFAEAAAKNEAVRNVSFSDPDIAKKQAAPDKKRMIILAAVAAVVAIIFFAIILMPKGGAKETGDQGGSDNPTPAPVSGNATYLCEYNYGDSDLSSFGSEASAGNRVVTIDFNDNTLTSLESKETITYTDSGVVRANLIAAKRQYVDTFTAAGFDSDPTTSSYEAGTDSFTITHQTDNFGDDVIKLLGFKPFTALNADSVQDSLEDSKFSCHLAE